MPLPRLFPLFAGVALLAAPLTLRAAEAYAPVNNQAISLPPMIVEEKVRPLEWRYLEVPGMEVLSVVDDAIAQDFIRQHLRLDDLLTTILPKRFQLRSAVPEGHILFTENTDRARSEEIVKELMAQQRARSADNPGRANPLRTIRFVPNMRLWDQDETVIFSVLKDSREASSDLIFAADRVAFMMERRAPKLPDWFVVGTLGLHERVRFSEEEGGSIEIQPMLWLSRAEVAALGASLEQPRTLLPLQEMFAGRRPATGVTPTELDQIWEAQCTLFVRWAVADKDPARRESLWKLVDRLEREPLTEALFREHFGMGFSDARDRLSDYLPQAVKESEWLKAPEPGPQPRLRLRPATDIEIARVRGAWERLQISYVGRRYPEFVDKYIEQARLTLYRLYDRGHRDPRLLAEIGLAEIDAGNPLAAGPFLEKAMEANVTRPKAYFELARLRFLAVPDITNPAVKLTPAQTASILAPLLQGRRHEPPLSETYALLADVLTRSTALPTTDQLAALDEGLRLFPERTQYVLRVAYFHMTTGNIPRALTVTETGLRHAPDATQRARLEQVRTELLAMRK